MAIEQSGARQLWRAIEPIHAVCYFDPRPARALADLGLRGWWMGYFAGRFGPLGAVGAGPVTALAFGFAPRMVERAIPDAWGFADPGAVVERRLASCGDTLQDLLGPERATDVGELVELLTPLVDACDVGGRALAASWRDVPAPAADPARLWHLATVLREHRGDGHVAAAIAHGFDGLESSITHVATGATTRADVQPNRGWTDEEWDATATRLRNRGVLSPDGGLTLDGQDRREAVEVATDRLAGRPLAALDSDRLRRAIEVARALSRTLVAAGTFPVPNPMGAPDPG